MKRNLKNIPASVTRRQTVNSHHVLTHCKSVPRTVEVCKRLIDTFAVSKPRCLNMKQLLQYHETKGNSEQFQQRFNYLSTELPTRFANIIKEMQELPEDFRQHYAFAKIEKAYFESFNELEKFSNSFPLSTAINTHTANEYNAIVSTVTSRHANIIEEMQTAVLEYHHLYKKSASEEELIAVQVFLDRFYMFRIATRQLSIEHLHATDPNTLYTKDSIAQRGVQVNRILLEAYKDAQALCKNEFFHSPALNIKNPGNVTVSAVPAHMHYIFFELLKNSMKATMIQFGRIPEHEKATVPPIDITVKEGRRDITIKISDPGIGAANSKTRQWYKYAYSTSPNPINSNGSFMSGLGVGLPLSRLYARYFSGELCINSIEGVGTDAYVHFKTLNVDKEEQIPNCDPDMPTKEIFNGHWSTIYSQKC